MPRSSAAAGCAVAMFDYRLAKLAAIWAFFKLDEQSEISSHKPSEFSKLGTQNWLSFAYLRAGAFWTLEGCKEKARQLYVEALSQEINYRDVWFNLGYLDIEDKEYDHAIERLSRAQELSRSGDSLPNNYQWYLATYQLAAVYHYISKQSKAAEDLHKAEKVSSELVEKINDAIDRLQSNTEVREMKLKRFLQGFKLNANIMSASIIADQGKLDEAELKIKSIDKEGSKFPYRVHYNFACYYSIFGKKTKSDETKSTDAYNKALSHLEYAIERGGGIINWAKNDPSLEGIRKDRKDDFDKIINKYTSEDFD